MDNNTELSDGCSWYVSRILENSQVAEQLNRAPSVYQGGSAYWESLGGGWFRLITQDNEVIGNLKAEWGHRGYYYTAAKAPRFAERRRFDSALTAARWVGRIGEYADKQ